MSKIVYKFQDNLYINLTNRCTARCTFCIKNLWKGRFYKHNLRLKKEPTAKQVIRAIKDPKLYKEIVFCGYGEPLIRLDEVIAISRWIKEKGGKVRINTSGHGFLIHKRNFLPQLKGLVDSISISLNATNAKQYFKLHKPIFGINTYKSILKFIRESKKYIPDVTITCIKFPKIDISKCRDIAKRLGVKFRARKYLE